MYTITGSQVSKTRLSVFYMTSSSLLDEIYMLNGSEETSEDFLQQRGVLKSGQEPPLR